MKQEVKILCTRVFHEWLIDNLLFLLPSLCVKIALTEVLYDQTVLQKTTQSHRSGTISDDPYKSVWTPQESEGSGREGPSNLQVRECDLERWRYEKLRVARLSSCLKTLEDSRVRPLFNPVMWSSEMCVRTCTPSPYQTLIMFVVSDR